MEPTTEQPETLPPAIVSRLRQLDRAQPIVDPRTDRAVLEAASRYFAARPASVPRRRARWTLPLGAAAAVLLAAVLMRPLVPGFGPPSRDDVDGSGRVDVLDVLALARMRAVGGDASGITDARIDELAYRIVALDSPRRVP
jgi:hypothetical protein